MPMGSQRMVLCLMVCAIQRMNFDYISYKISVITWAPFSLNVAWLEDEGMEIKRQITGMMRLLSDKTSRVYQRAGTEQDSLTKEPQEKPLNWINQPELLSLVSEDHQSNSWNSAEDPGPSPSSISIPVPNSPGCAQYSTRSRALRILNSTKGLIKVNETNGRISVHVWKEKTTKQILSYLKNSEFH